MIYPFTAIVGQEKMKKALILNAINPKVGGVLLRGDKGTGKSTAVRALADVLPEIEVSDCIFNCSREAMCDECRRKEKKFVKRRMRIVELPLSATEDRVVGTLDFERALKEGIKAFQPGILAEANNNILYIDEVNLLDDHIVDTLLDVAASGWNVIEREGISFRHPSRFILVGTMNPEEGELRPQLLDRFGMVVNVKAISDPELRAEVVKRVEEFSEDPEAFYKKFEPEQEKLRKRIEIARNILNEVTVPDEIVHAVARLCGELGIETHRADIITIRAAKALAAFKGRKEVILEDIMEVVELTLPHRLKSKPFEEPKLDFDKIENILRDAIQENTIEEERKEKKEESKAGEDVEITTKSGREIKQEMGKTLLPNLDLSSKMEAVKGKRVKSVGKSGRYVDFRLSGEEIAIGATVRATLSRGARIPEERDYRYKICSSRSASSIAVLVDASSSMISLRRMEFAKGLIFRLLQDAYVRKDRVSMITFKNNSAEVIVPPTSSPQLAAKRLAELTTGGKTPLAAGLLKARDLLKIEMRKGYVPILVLITDGRANVPILGDIRREIEEISEAIARDKILTVVFDADDYVSLGYAKEISEITGGLYYRLKELSEEKIFGVVDEIRRSFSF